MHLYDISENAAALQGDFQATVEEIGAIMQTANPEDVKTVPTGDAFLDLAAINAASAQ